MAWRCLAIVAVWALASASLPSGMAEAAAPGTASSEPVAVNEVAVPASGVPSVAPTPTPEPLMPPARQKATTLFNFLSFIEFPPATLPRPDSPLVIGVTGADSVYDELGEILKGRMVNGRIVLRRRLQESDSLAGVHLLFVGGKVNLAQNSLVKAAKSSSVLLVTEVPDGLESGAIFNFVMEGDRVRFEAALEAAERASIRISSRILTLAERVTRSR
ncbi:MAG: YfiR family protein [Aquabacterium sp.]